MKAPQSTTPPLTLRLVLRLINTGESEENPRFRARAYSDHYDRDVLCAAEFCALMNQESLPDVISVVVSNRPIPGAARVPLEWNSPRWEWFDWNGIVHQVFPAAEELLSVLLPGQTEGTVWIDWEASSYVVSSVEEVIASVKKWEGNA